MYLMKAGTVEVRVRGNLIWDTRGCMTIEEEKMKVDVAGLAPATQSSCSFLPVSVGSPNSQAAYCGQHFTRPTDAVS
jgi:hypothetical protein